MDNTEDDQLVQVGEVLVPQHIHNRLLAIADGREIIVCMENGDGHCGFRAVSRSLWTKPDEFLVIRHAAVEEMKENQDRFEPLARASNANYLDWTTYIHHQQEAAKNEGRTEIFCDQACLQAISDRYNRKLLLLSVGVKDYTVLFEPASNSNGETLILIMHDGNHFDSVFFVQTICDVPHALKDDSSTSRSHSNSVSATDAIPLVPQDVGMDASAIGRAIRAMYGPLRDTAENCDTCRQQHCGKCVKGGCKKCQRLRCKEHSVCMRCQCDLDENEFELDHVFECQYWGYLCAKFPQMTVHELSLVSFAANSKHNSQRLCSTCNIEKREVVRKVILADGVYDMTSLLLTAHEDFDYEGAIQNFADVILERNGGQLTEVLSALISLLRENVTNY